MEVISYISYILNLYISSSPVNIPMGGYYEVYTSMFEQRGFSYANVRKASYTGKVRYGKSSNYSDHQHYISVQDLDNWWNLSLYVL